MSRYPGFLLALCLLFFACPAQAQPSQQGPLVNQLPADSPALYRQFFYFHLSFTEWLATRTAGKAPAEVTDLNRKAASSFGLQQTDYQQLVSMTSATARELRAIDQEQNAHANFRARYEQHPVPTVMQQFESRRQDAANRGLAQLQKTLSPEAWSAVRGYINGPFRNGIRVR